MKLMLAVAANDSFGVAVLETLEAAAAFILRKFNYSEILAT